ncbi:hypothetical protein LTR56_012490 [Elasticomyces elasticus]|nr:hypothetical protein LTR56_012490 [Elasticomyces elasticus]KAK4907340.1 hypothetical protein LTR49_023624 [Elasticomyces elasticus]
MDLPPPTALAAYHPHAADRELASRTARVADRRQKYEFVPVESTGVMASTEVEGLGSVMAGLKWKSSAGLRAGRFSENGEDGEGLLALKKTVSQEAERREKESRVPVANPEHAVTSTAVTPMMQANTEQKEDDVEESPLAHKTDKEPDKPITTAEEKPRELQPAELTNEAAVSGRKTLALFAEDLREQTHVAQKTPKSNGTQEATASAELKSAVKKAKQAEPEPRIKPMNGRPTTISTKPAQKPSTKSAKSPASLPKTPVSARASAPTKARPSEPADAEQPSTKVSRSSLTAPTAASVARADRSVSASSKQSPPAKPKLQEGTKTVELPSRILAPTTAFRAKHDANPAPSHSIATGKTSTTARSKPQPTTTRPNARESLQCPDSRASHASKKPSAPDGDFLERMMRPTVASSSKTHEKLEAKSPPRRRPAVPGTKTKTNRHAKKSPKVEESAPQEPEEDHLRIKNATPTAADGATASDGPGGVETPVPQTNGGASIYGVLETTPAFGETIR